MTKSVLILLLFTVFNTGCNDVQSHDLRGTWVIKDSSRQVLPPTLRNASAQIFLAADGSFTVSDIPGLLYFPGKRDVGLESGRGSWRLDSHDGSQFVLLTFDDLTGSKPIDLPYGAQLDLSKGWSETNLYYFIGDADEGRKVEFQKR
jgi:hypothetical protein